MCELFVILNPCCLFCILYICYIIPFFSLLCSELSIPSHSPSESAERHNPPAEICVLIHLGVNQEISGLTGPVLYIPPHKLKQEGLHCTGPHWRKWSSGDGKKQMNWVQGRKVHILLNLDKLSVSSRCFLFTITLLFLGMLESKFSS